MASIISGNKGIKMNPYAIPELADPIRMSSNVCGKPKNLDGPNINNEIEVSTKQISINNLLGKDLIM